MRTTLLSLPLLLLVTTWPSMASCQADGLSRASAATIAARRDYATTQRRLQRQRAVLAAELARARTPAARDAVLNRARQLLLDDAASLMAAWLGTAWDYYGTSEVPGQGRIACGYLVSTVLRDTGFRVERVRLAQQASERIIQTLIPETRIWRYSDRPVDELLADVASNGDGIYLLGLDYHAGMLLRRDGETSFCHSSVLGQGEVVCSDPRADPAMASRYRVVGSLLNDRTLRAWLRDEPFSTRTH